MAVEGSHCCGVGKRRGDNLPARLRFAARRGVTLIELLIAMLILAITCVSWLRIIGVQSARREARRREAVERLVGMMDAFMYVNTAGVKDGNYCQTSSDPLAFGKTSNVSEPIHDLAPLGYRLCVVKNLDYLSAGDNDELFEGNASLFTGNWKSKRWLIGILYDKDGATAKDVGRPIFTLPVCLGI